MYTLQIANIITSCIYSICVALIGVGYYVDAKKSGYEDINSNAFDEAAEEDFGVQRAYNTETVTEVLAETTESKIKSETNTNVEPNLTPVDKSIINFIDESTNDPIGTTPVDEPRLSVEAKSAETKPSVDAKSNIVTKSKVSAFLNDAENVRPSKPKLKINKSAQEEATEQTTTEAVTTVPAGEPESTETPKKIIRKRRIEQTESTAGPTVEPVVEQPTKQTKIRKPASTETPETIPVAEQPTKRVVRRQVVAPTANEAPAPEAPAKKTVTKTVTKPVDVPASTNTSAVEPTKKIVHRAVPPTENIAKHTAPTPTAPTAEQPTVKRTRKVAAPTETGVIVAPTTPTETPAKRTRTVATPAKTDAPTTPAALAEAPVKRTRKVAAPTSSEALVKPTTTEAPTTEKTVKKVVRRVVKRPVDMANTAANNDIIRPTGLLNNDKSTNN